MKNTNRTFLDGTQIEKATYQEDRDAIRVHLISTEFSFLPKEYNTLPKWLIICLLVQILTSLSTLLVLILRK